MALTLIPDKLQEQKRQRYAFFWSMGISVLVFLIMYLWRIQFFNFPVLLEYGMEVTFGQDKVGSGTQNIPIESITNTADNSPQPDETQTKAEKNETIATNPHQSETNLNQKDKKKPIPIKENKKKSTSAKQQPSQIEPGKDNRPGQGNDNQPGVKGKTSGINEAGLYEGSGGRGGSSLSLKGWTWEKDPIVNDASSETGRIIFSVIVDSEGYFITVKLVSSTITNRDLIEKYRQAVLNSTLVSTTEDASKQDATGIVTFILKAK
jgi:hypothetical protein